MVGLYTVALQNVGINGALGKKFNALQLSCLLLEHADELGADDLALLLRLSHVLQLIQEAVNRIYIDQVGIHLIAEYLYHLLRLALAQKTVIYVNANQLLSNCLN